MKKTIIASLLATVVILGFTTIKSNAEWKENNVGWWYSEGNSWATGWREINGKWYYFDQQGYMAKNTVVDGYYVNENGEWVPSYSMVQNNNSTTDIGQEKAKEIAFNNAGVPSDKVTYVRVDLDYEFGFKTYEIDFYYNNVEYDYEIEALTGNILKADKETKYYESNNISQNNYTSVDIGIEKAKQIAMDNAGVSSSSIRDLDVDFDYDNGVKIYEIDFKSGNMEYEYDINALTGVIEKYDSEYDD